MDSKTKRKRTKNTTPAQLELYVGELENNYYFRSGVMNPTQPENYLRDVWANLAAKLNAQGDGPNLTVDEWKKRLNDWKYSLKAKSRKIRAHHLGTGGGPPADDKFTPLEERALGMWGKITVVGDPDIPEIIDGLPLPLPAEAADDNAPDEQEPEHTPDEHVPEVIIIEHVAPEEPPRKRARSRPQPLPVLAEQLMQATSTHGQHGAELNCILERQLSRYNDNMDRALNFEIQKYEYENPNFKFQN